MTQFDRRRLLKTGAAFGGLAGIAQMLQGCDALRPNDDGPIRIGWQTAWASQGQVMEALLRTNIPTLADSRLSFTGFQYGPDLNEAAVSNSIDVTNAGIVPVINLLAKSADWMIVGRQTDFYISIIARPGAGVETVAQLRGKRFGVPIGGGSHPFAISQLRRAGLGSNDVEILNVAPTEMLLAFQRGDLDAVAVWDPTAQLIREAGGRIISEQPYVGFITAHRRLIEQRAGELQNMLEAYGLAYLYAAQNKAQVDGWFSEDSGMPLELVSRLRVIEPNLQATDLRAVTLVPADVALELCQQVADTMLELELLQTRLDVRSRVSATAASAAEQSSQSMTSLISRISVA